MASQNSASVNYLEQFTSIATTMVSYIRIPLLASSGIAAVLSSILYFKQKALIYPSHIPANARTEVPRPTQFGISDFEELMIPTPDGETLSAFFIRAPNKAQSINTTVLMFHGNAGNIGHRVPIARMLTEAIGCNAFMLEYRGYGLSTGAPDEKGIMIDAQVALDYIHERAETKDNQIVIYGQSLGGAVAIRLAANNRDKDTIAGLVLENTFLSMRKLIPNIIPPARYLTLLCHQVWSSEYFLPSVRVPILFLSGQKDELVPPSHMQKLYDICQSPTKVWKALPGGDHNSSVVEPGYFQAVADFVKSLRKSS